MDKHYGLTNKPSAGAKDTAPEWMDDFFKNVSQEKPLKKQHPFEGIEDPILNPQRIGLNKNK